MVLILYISIHDTKEIEIQALYSLYSFHGLRLKDYPVSTQVKINHLNAVLCVHTDSDVVLPLS